VPTKPGTDNNNYLSFPGLVVMVELGVCQHYSDLSEPNRPNQDGTSVPIVIGISLQSIAIDAPCRRSIL
jgi:hypothetical protein